MVHYILISWHRREGIKSHKSIFVDRIKILLSIGYADLLIALKSGFIFMAVTHSSYVHAKILSLSGVFHYVKWSMRCSKDKVLTGYYSIQHSYIHYSLHFWGIHKGMGGRTFQMQNLSIRKHKILRWQPKVIFLMDESEYRACPHGTLSHLNI